MDVRRNSRCAHLNQEKLSEELTAKCMLLNVGIEKSDIGQGPGWVMWNSYWDQMKGWLHLTWNDDNGKRCFIADSPEQLMQIFTSGRGKFG